MKALDHINLDNPTDIQTWANRLYDLRIDLYQAMGKAVGYTYNTDYLKRQIYLPKLFTDADAEGMAIRQTLAKVLTEGGLKVMIVGEPAATAPPPPPPTPAL